jgi:hypothetical protein
MWYLDKMTITADKPYFWGWWRGTTNYATTGDAKDFDPETPELLVSEGECASCMRSCLQEHFMARKQYIRIPEQKKNWIQT